MKIKFIMRFIVAFVYLSLFIPWFLALFSKITDDFYTDWVGIIVLLALPALSLLLAKVATTIIEKRILTLPSHKHTSKEDEPLSYRGVVRDILFPKLILGGEFLIITTIVSFVTSIVLGPLGGIIFCCFTVLYWLSLTYKLNKNVFLLPTLNSDMPPTQKANNILILLIMFILEGILFFGAGLLAFLFVNITLHPIE